MTDYDDMFKIREICYAIVSERNDPIQNVRQLCELLTVKKNSNFLRGVERDIVTAFFVILRKEYKNELKLTEDHKLNILQCLHITFTQTFLEKVGVFFYYYGHLVNQIYDVDKHQIRTISEEMKLSILRCTISLINSVPTSLTPQVYAKETGKPLSHMIYVALQISLTEKFKTLRIEAIECLMALFKVQSDSDYGDKLYGSLVAESLSFFLPGVTGTLTKILRSSNKIMAYELIQVTIKALGRIISMLMQDYTMDSSKTTSLMNAKLAVLQLLESNRSPPEQPKINTVNDYMNSERNRLWFKKSDENVSKAFHCLRTLTHHARVEVRKELADLCYLVILNCSTTMPLSIRPLWEIVIILLEDESDEVVEIARKVKKELESIMSSEQQISLINSFQEPFYEAITRLPMVFNGLETEHKLISLQLTIGYVNLFGVKLQFVPFFREFLHVLIRLCKFSEDNSILNRSLNKEVDFECNAGSSANNFRYMKYLSDPVIRDYFSNLCRCFVKNELFEAVSDFAITLYREHEDDRKEAIYILNNLILGLKDSSYDNQFELIKPIFDLYIDRTNWNLCLEGAPRKVLASNVQQAALQVEGLGLMAEVLKRDYMKFLLKSIFLVLSRAGSELEHLRNAGKGALKNMANAFDHPNITSFINANMDYCVFFIERDLKKNNLENYVFDVLEFVISYGDKTTVDYLLVVVQQVLVQSCDEYKHNQLDSYLTIFKTFLKTLLRVFEGVAPEQIFKTKKQKEEELLRSFKVTGLDNVEEINEFSDDVMEKSAEEMYNEDLARKELEKDEDDPVLEGYKKPEPPAHVKTTIAIMKRSLNFLPSKLQQRQLIVLHVLQDGLEIIKDYEDELLPVVHLIWSPLVARFKDFKEPTILYHSFSLLTVMGRVAKDFIRNRTVKDVFPSIIKVLEESSKESCKSNIKSTYRYHQSYKLQEIILQRLGYLIMDLDVLADDLIEIVKVVTLYLNNKQPKTFQMEAAQFFQTLEKYDESYRDKIVSSLE